MSGKFTKGIQFSSLPLVAQEQIRRQVGDKVFDRLLKKDSIKTGRYRVGEKERRTADGVLFDSIWEMRVYQMLKATVPKNRLHLQPRFLLQEKFIDRSGVAHRAIEYVADFLIGEPRIKNNDPLTDEHVVLDAKGHRTDYYCLKKKLFLRQYEPRFYEVSSEADVRNLTIK